MQVTLEDRQARLRQLLAGFERCVVAYSGGVDSAYLLAEAHAVLGERAVGVTARSASLPAEELRAAVDLARAIGARHETIDTQELADPRYAANAPDRCYFCKSELFTRLEAIAKARPGTVVAYGELADDAGDYRPGAQAAREFGVRAPLAEAGLTKADVRELSRRIGLPTAEKPAMACLSSRVPYGTAITSALLGQVERAEAALHALGFADVRVRHHGDVARIEVPRERIAELASDPVRTQVQEAVRAAGFRWVTVDLAGYRRGSLNERLVVLPVIDSAR